MIVDELDDDCQAAEAEDAQPLAVGDKTACPPSSEHRTETGGVQGVVSVFRQWLHMPDEGPLLITLGAIAANRMPGPPVWVQLVGPPGSGKTEISVNPYFRCREARLAVDLEPPGVAGDEPAVAGEVLAERQAGRCDRDQRVDDRPQRGPREPAKEAGIEWAFEHEFAGPNAKFTTVNMSAFQAGLAIGQQAAVVRS